MCILDKGTVRKAAEPTKTLWVFEGIPGSHHKILSPSSDHIYKIVIRKERKGRRSMESGPDAQASVATHQETSQ